MKWFLAVAAVAVCCSAATATAAPAPASLQASCSAIPSAYRGSSQKTALWVASCVVCKRLGPRQMARGAHLSNSSRTAVARWYAQKYVNTAAFRRIAPQFGGAAAARPIIQAGCLAGFQARGRP
jgi:hypothetical protein